MYSGNRQPLATRNLNASTTSSSGSGPATQVIRSTKFPYKLSFYDRPPLEEITVEEFETWGIDRLRVLADIESAQARNRTFDDIKKLVEGRLKTYLPLSDDGAKGVDTDTERRKDQYSHYILRLAFSRSEELRDRFLRVERSLFRIRWDLASADERRQFVDSLNFGWEVVGPEEKAVFAAQLGAMGNTESYFKVHWTKVVDLVDKRRVFIHKGQAFVPSKEEISLVLTEFSARLQRGLEMTAKMLPRLDEDERLLPVLQHLSMGFMAGITSEYNVSTNAMGEAITAEMVPELSKTSFPLCMRSMQETLKSSHHLKHEGRQQYGLFLKGIGLSVEEALVFWRRSFSNITDDKFKKEYQYNIRHTFGLEGSRKSYAPKTCLQIITGPSPATGQVHGCPFRHFNEANLSAALSSMYNLNAADQKEILKATKDHHYHVACTRLFEIQHAHKGVAKGDGIGNGDSVDHPNRFFDASRALYIEKTEEVKPEKMEVD
ncbi:DNA primase large subunit [Meredithblackwellia eburnea MCA 4105]